LWGVSLIILYYDGHVPHRSAFRGRLFHAAVYA
jgi:hypothetical protein